VSVLSILEAVILGIVQGFTEFLPVSSSGHLIIAQKTLGIEEPMLAYNIVLHLGSLVAVLAVFWKDIVGFITKPFQNLMYMLVAATIPAIIAGFFFVEQIEVLFEGGLFLALCFIITGFLLFYSDGIQNNKKQDKDIKLSNALVIGCVQALAISPGISRSGSTIAAGLHQGLTRETAARFSFLLSIPTILGAAVLMAIDVMGSVEGASAFVSNIEPLLFGFFAAMLSGYLSIRFMLDLIKKSKLRYFGFYVLILAKLILADVIITQRFF